VIDLAFLFWRTYDIVIIPTSLHDVGSYLEKLEENAVIQWILVHGRKIAS
jgi:hypothetical protein